MAAAPVATVASNKPAVLQSAAIASGSPGVGAVEAQSAVQLERAFATTWTVPTGLSLPKHPQDADLRLQLQTVKAR